MRNFLWIKGLRVAKWSARSGGGISQHGSQVLPGVVAVPVPRPSRTFTDTLVFFKRQIYRKKRVAASPGSIAASSPSAAMTSTGSLARIRDLYFQMVCFIDEYKSWGRRAYNAAVREGEAASTEADSFLVSSAYSSPGWVRWPLGRLHVLHIVDLRDPWSDATAGTASQSPDPNWRFDRKIEGWVMRSAAAITSTGTRVAHLMDPTATGIGTGKRESSATNGCRRRCSPLTLRILAVALRSFSQASFI